MREGIHYSTRKVIYNSAATYQIDKLTNVFKLFNLAPKIGRPRSATPSSITVTTRQVGK